MTEKKPHLLDFSYPQLETWVKDIGLRAFRAKQIWFWVWGKRITDFWKMTDLRKDIRQELEQGLSLFHPQVHTVRRSRDGTIKFLVEPWDGGSMEAVLIPEEDHYTLCLSSQIGCSLGCSFCSTGQMGFSRNLSSGEILAQILLAQNLLEEENSSLPLRNLVFMGMGEPLLNWPQVKKALEIIRDDRGLGFSMRRTTLSTVGIPGPLQEFAQTGLGSLAVSLHAPTQELRARLMPRAASIITLAQLIRTLQDIPLKPRQRITLEYILIHGVNDSLQHAKQLNKLVSSLRCKINLIALNPDEGIPYSSPSQDRILDFEKFLLDKDKSVFLRKSKGADIEAACGQLKNKAVPDNNLTP